MVERVLTPLRDQFQGHQAAADPAAALQVQSSAREEARLFCGELVADEAVAAMQHDLIAA